MQVDDSFLIRSEGYYSFYIIVVGVRGFDVSLLDR